jgi:hypothetical protein
MFLLTFQPSSPRSVTKFCHGIEYGYLASELTATLISLAHCSGWSADRIRLAILEKGYHFNESAEWIWHLHRQWMLVRGPSGLSTEEADIADFLLQDFGLDSASQVRPLSNTHQPVSNEFEGREERI